MLGIWGWGFVGTGNTDGECNDGNGARDGCQVTGLQTNLQFRDRCDKFINKRSVNII